MQHPSMIERHGLLRRRALLLAAGGLAGHVVVGCGGGGDAPAAAPATSAAVLRLQSFAAGSGTANATLQNEAGGGISVFTSGTGALDQVLYRNGGATHRVFYGANGAVERVVDEATGEFLTVTSVDAMRTDFNLYDANGAWLAGLAILQAADGSWSSAPIVSSSGLAGKQITGSLTGAVTAAFSLLPTGTAGLGAATQLGTSATLFAQVVPRARPTTLAAALDRLTDRIFPMAQAQSFTTGNLFGLVKGAFIATAGALVYTSTLPLAPLIGTAIMGYGAYKIYQELTNVQSANWGQIDATTSAILGGAMDDFRSGNADPLDTLKNKVSEYLDRGSSALSGLPTFDSVRAAAKTTASNVASTVTSTARTAWQEVTGAPPAGSTPLEGLLVDNNGNSSSTTGTYDPASDTVTFDTGAASGVRIQGSGGAGSGGSTGNGTYTVTNNGVQTGNGTFTSTTQALGACQTNASSGGQGAFTHVYDMGQESGTFELSYNMYSIPDRLEVKGSDGTSLFSTGGLVSGTDTVQVSFSGGRMVYVIVTAPTDGTAWDYSIGCPQ